MHCPCPMTHVFVKRSSPSLSLLSDPPHHCPYAIKITVVPHILLPIFSDIASAQLLYPCSMALDRSLPYISSAWCKPCTAPAQWHSLEYITCHIYISSPYKSSTWHAMYCPCLMALDRSLPYVYCIMYSLHLISNVMPLPNGVRWISTACIRPRLAP